MLSLFLGGYLKKLFNQQFPSQYLFIIVPRDVTVQNLDSSMMAVRICLRLNPSLECCSTPIMDLPCLRLVEFKQLQIHKSCYTLLLFFITNLQFYIVKVGDIKPDLSLKELTESCRVFQVKCC